MTLDVEVDIGDIVAMSDVIHNATNAIGKKTTLNRIVTAAARDGRQKFGDLIDLAAASNPSAYHHLYDGEATGSRTNRLFTLSATRAAEGRITNLVDFIPSTRTVPQREMVGQVVDVQITLSSGTTFTKKVEVWPNQRDHVFRDKASVMENGVTVDIEPRNARMLFWVDPVEEVGYMNTGMQLDYSEKPTHNSFMTLWNMFWSEMAEERVLIPLVDSLEPVLYKNMEQMIRKESAQGRDITPPPPGVTRITDDGGPIKNGGRPTKDIGMEKEMEQAIGRVLDKYA